MTIKQSVYLITQILSYTLINSNLDHSTIISLVLVDIACVCVCVCVCMCVCVGLWMCVNFLSANLYMKIIYTIHEKCEIHIYSLYFH